MSTKYMKFLRAFSITDRSTRALCL